ncbi:hypothetical protein DICPUDRAFT_157805 [Dictyostelium purpureum]|uniref:HssA/2C/7E family protein n=1 Tax=Dictyostelium purpureum TaxID=5786 RepID=F1A019_DICPU|nr:uncharacterized protein DICPUDRAFT_157805 [Dictyostelium purpureum]EGC30457.1 hypothetical protein DICPUDRAFT_157805 [Dictyostelium purpureum]|eukprot:XP_003293012.1 hypothetical protein DICPUDRAFT_157805 [Dictyostelium purpureum]
MTILGSLVSLSIKSNKNLNSSQSSLNHSLVLGSNSIQCGSGCDNNGTVPHLVGGVLNTTGVLVGSVAGTVGNLVDGLIGSGGNLGCY